MTSHIHGDALTVPSEPSSARSKRTPVCSVSWPRAAPLPLIRIIVRPSGARSGDAVERGQAARTRLVLDDHLAAERLADVGRDHAGVGVVAASGREADRETHGLALEVVGFRFLRTRTGGEHRDSGDCEQMRDDPSEPRSRHAILPEAPGLLSYGACHMIGRSVGAGARRCQAKAGV